MKKNLWKRSLLLCGSALLAAGALLTPNLVNAQDDVTTLTFFSVDLSMDDPFTNPVAQEITARTGVKLELSHPVGGDEQAIPLMIASGDFPDLIYSKGDLN